MTVHVIGIVFKGVLTAVECFLCLDDAQERLRDLKEEHKNDEDYDISLHSTSLVLELKTHE